MKSKFKKGLLIYALVMLAVIFIGLFVFWQYIKAYEYSRPDYVVDRYVQRDLQRTLSRNISNYTEQTAFETAEEQTQVLQDLLNNGNFTFRKDTEEYTEETPVYAIYMGKQELGKIWLASDGNSFGFSHWEVASSAFDLNRFAQTYTVTAPESVAVTANGVRLSAENCDMEQGVPEPLALYAGELVQPPDWVTYRFTAVSLPEVRLDSDSEEYWMSWDETNPTVFTVTQQCGVELSEQLHTYAKDFVTAYINFTSNATGPGLASTYVLPGGTLYQRINGAGEAMRWVHGITYTMSDLTVDGLQYYGTAATVEAHYILTPYNNTIVVGNDETHSNMHIVLTQTDSGWRVADIELYEG